jgi:hypothetical protein
MRKKVNKQKDRMERLSYKQAARLPLLDFERMTNRSCWPLLAQKTEKGMLTNHSLSKRKT